MSYPYTPKAVNHNATGTVGFGGPPSLPPPPGGPVLPPPSPQYRDDKKSRRGFAVVAVIAGSIGVFVAGALGVYVGSRLTSTGTQQQAAQAASGPPTTVPIPTAEQVYAATVDLCTRFAGGYRAMPRPQNNGFDVVPTANYIADALRDNPAADTRIRDAVSESLAFLRGHIALASGAKTAGAIQIPQDWTAEEANAADQRVWDLCRAYGG